MNRVLIDKVKIHPSASAGWAIMLLPKHYAILGLNQSGFQLYCKTITYQKNLKLNQSADRLVYNPIDCSKVLVIKVMDMNRKKGSYWLVENAKIKSSKPLSN